MTPPRQLKLDEKGEEFFYPERFTFCGCGRPGLRLGFSHRTHARLLGLTHDEYLAGLIRRTEGIQAKRKPFRRRQVAAVAGNAVLVIGGGPSVTVSSLRHVKQFNGPVIVCDVRLGYLLEAGVVPEYVATLEAIIRRHHIPKPYIEVSRKAKFICSALTNESVFKYLIESGADAERFISKAEARITNVGLFCVYYAKEVLQADKICLLGFEHTPPPYDQHIYDEWTADFWHFADQWPADLIVNCSNGGVLYGDTILDGTWPLEVMCE